MYNDEKEAVGPGETSTTETKETTTETTETKPAVEGEGKE